MDNGHRRTTYDELPTTEGLGFRDHELDLTLAPSTYDDARELELEHTRTPVPAPKEQKSSPLHTVLWEMTSLLLATLSLIGLVILLATYRAKPNPNWSLGGYVFTLNAVIAILGTLFKACLLVPVTLSISQFGWIWLSRRSRPLQDLCFFNSASRGPLGCLRLLYRLRLVHFASLAAFITVISLALDPIFQQLVRYDTQAVVDANSQALAVAAYTWNTKTIPTAEMGDYYVSMPYNMKAAMYTGLLSSNSISPPNPLFNCPSGNCTWDPFGTLAVRTQCTDFSDSVAVKCQTEEGLGLTCNFTAPKTSIIGQMLNGSNQYDVLVMGNADLRYFVPSPLLEKPHANAGYLAGVQWVKALGNLGFDGVSLYIQRNTTFEAATCFFSLSILEVKPRVLNGLYQETILQEYTEPSSTSGIPYWENDGTEYGFLNPVAMLDTPIDRALIYKPPFAKSSPNLNDTFSIPYDMVLMLISALGSDPSLLTGTIDTAGTSGLDGPDLTSMLFRADNVTRAMYAIADYMTNSLRANDSLLLQAQQQKASMIAPSQAILGSVLVQRQFVTVQWGWIAIPALLLLLTVVVLLVAMLETRASRVGLWQDSPLTLFFHGKMNGGSIEKVGEEEILDTAGAMQDAAAHYDVKILRDEKSTIEVTPRAATSGELVHVQKIISESRLPGKHSAA